VGLQSDSAVGAFYDRAFGPLTCESCAVIDRAYRDFSGCSLADSDVDVHAEKSSW